MAINGKSPASAAPLLKNAAAAPLVYFDTVPVFGTYAGNLEIELACRLLMPKADGGVTADMSCAGHLRCSPQAAVELIDALRKGLEMLSRQQAAQSELLQNAREEQTKAVLPN